jgi:hypothetical protein
MNLAYGTRSESSLALEVEVVGVEISRRQPAELDPWAARDSNPDLPD